MARSFFSSFAEVALVDTRLRSGTIILPPISQIPYRVLSFKDVYGTLSNSTLVLSTQAGNTFEDSTTRLTLSNNYTFYSLYAASTKWVLLNGSQTLVQTVSSLQVNSLQVGAGTGWIQMPPMQSIALSTNQIYATNTQAITLSTLQLNMSSITGQNVFTTVLSTTTAALSTVNVTGQMGIGRVPFSTLSLDVNGMFRGKLFISTVTTTALTVLPDSYGIYHNLTNTGFNALTLTSLAGINSNFGWYVLLRNSTGTPFSVTLAGASCNNIPSPLPMAPSTNTTLSWDGAFFRVF